MQIRSLMLVAALLGAGPVASQPLSLEEALRAGEAQSPRLAAQRHALASAGEQSARARELPDPKLKLGIENLPVTGADRFHYGRDFMTARTVGLAQEFPNAAKREARSLRAEGQRGLESASLELERAALARDIATAWLELHHAERARVPLESLARQLKLQADTLAPAIARGRQGAAEGLMLRHAHEQANQRLIEQDRSIARARIALGAWIGEDAKRPLAAAPDTTRLAREELLARLAEHPQLRAAEQRERVARAEAELARSTRRSDWMLEVEYGQRRPFFDNMLTVMVSFDLPWRAERRQDRDVASRLAEVEQARALREDARRTQEAEVRGALADFDAAAQRIERFERVLLPLAGERRDAALAAYQAGRSELGTVLEAERAIAETELALVQALAERGRAWANLSFIYLNGSQQ